MYQAASVSAVSSVPAQCPRSREPAALYAVRTGGWIPVSAAPAAHGGGGAWLAAGPIGRPVCCSLLVVIRGSVSGPRRRRTHYRAYLQDSPWLATAAGSGRRRSLRSGPSPAQCPRPGQQPAPPVCLSVCLSVCLAVCQPHFTSKFRPWTDRCVPKTPK